MARYLFLILVLTGNLFSKVYEDLDRGALQNVTSLELRINGAVGSGKVFYSKFDLNTAKDAFRSFMRGKGFSETGDCGNIASYQNGEMKIKAIFSPGEKGTAIIALETKGEEKRTEDGDVPGADLVDIPRPKNSKRELCLERLSGKERSTTIIYEIKESPSSCANYYQNLMENYGWSSILSEKSKEGTLLAFEATNKWCNIFIGNERVIMSHYSR
ncbi:MAG: hypothetical protein A2452_13370 [Candidatus Firestonebacteria bacterium RIFOXYC2_FULL_39_67]|nr:MAG: hypothetical protein A2536_05220 [Candidatus Firestonebacteria bacterium RIFOXYD2_FULL_39_29]OGF56196.1 MAG: hypothetical protein A2452_13370 [Candidatus Firestonebacteria bacterium RIFOXYC2_FULL_39_67]OGF57275.1 MAG: hypothetical protein A2497_03600 [Candidatus Firestonebacteria bacterium RifOxyC12_full_39_7]